VIPDVPPSVAIAVASGRVAVVPVDRGPTPSRSFSLRAAPNGPVEIRDARTGRLALQVVPRGEVQVVELSEIVVAVLVNENGTMRLEVYDARTGAKLSSVRVPSKTSLDLDVAGRMVVYRVGRAIRLLRAGERATSLLAVAASKPIGLSIEGTRVAWAEQHGERGRIQAVALR
jgi:hypothetical protein